MKNIEITKTEGLKCDNPKCDWIDDTIIADRSHIDMPCPKCGESVLTKEDYEMFETLMLTMKAINNLSPEQMKQLTDGMTEEEMRQYFEAMNITIPDHVSVDDPIAVSIKVHKEIKIDIKNEE